VLIFVFSIFLARFLTRGVAPMNAIISSTA
jgi:hypothetical protein